MEELRRGNFATALTLADQGLQSSTSDRQRFTLLKAEILLFRRDAQGAITMLEPKTGGAPFDAQWVPRQQYLLGQTRIVQGRLADALTMLTEAQRAAEARGQHDVELDALLLEGQALLRMGRGGEGEEVLRTALGRAQTAKDTYREAVALHNLGYRRVIANRYDEAAPYFEQILATKSLEAYTVYATALTNSAVCQMKLGDYDRAIDVLQRATRVHEKSGSSVYLEQAVGELGNTYITKADFRASLPHLERALKLAKENHIDVDAARWAVNLATAHIQLRQWDDADRFNREAQALRNDRRDAPYFLLNVARIAGGRGDLAEARRVYAEAQAAAADNPAIQWTSHAELGRMYAAEGRAPLAAKEFETALDVIERAQSGLLKTDDRLSILPRLLTFYGSYVDLLVSTREYERALQVADSSRARVLAERLGVNAPLRATPAVLRQAAARSRAALVFYWIGPERSYAWVVTRDRIRFVAVPATADQITALAGKHQAFVVDSAGDVLASRSTPGDALYAALVAPLADALKGESRVILIPDSAMTRLNFDTLPVDSDRRHYLIDDFEIAVAPSLTMLASAPGADKPRDRNLLLIGDAVSADAQYPALRYASVEMAAVADAFEGRTSMYRGGDASPARYREAKPEQYGIVHFTAHAAANAESPLDSAVILSRGPSGYKLYARDVATLPLSADLVTISACRSAGEKTYGGEGLVGFAWAFLRAGSKRVVAGLWDVDDRSTADLMRDMYKGIAMGDSPGTALRAAKRAMIARGGVMAKPYYWGPFQLFVGSTVAP